MLAVADTTVLAAERQGDPYAAGGERILGLDATDGSVRWSADFAQLGGSRPVLDAEGPAVLASVDPTDFSRTIVALDFETGDRLWEHDGRPDEQVVAMTASAVVLYTSQPPPGWTMPITTVPPGQQPAGGGFSISFYRALDRRTGGELWQSEVQWPLSVDVGWATASVGGDVVAATPGLFVFDADTGAEIWRREVSSDSLGPIRDGVLLMGGQDQPTEGVDLATGDTLWTVPGSPPYSDVWAAGDGAVYLVEGRSEVVAYELADGSERWRRPFQDYSWPWHTSNGVVYSMWTNLDAIDAADGSLRWTAGYTTVDMPRLATIQSNSTLAVVSFSWRSSPGD